MSSQNSNQLHLKGSSVNRQTRKNSKQTRSVRSACGLSTRTDSSRRPRLWQPAGRAAPGRPASAAEPRPTSSSHGTEGGWTSLAGPQHQEGRFSGKGSRARPVLPTGVVLTDSANSGLGYQVKQQTTLSGESPGRTAMGQSPHHGHNHGHSS